MAKTSGKILLSQFYWEINTVLVGSDKPKYRLFYAQCIMHVYFLLNDDLSFPLKETLAATS